MSQSIHGTLEFAELSKRLKEAGETGLRRQLYRAIDKSAQDLAEEVQSTGHLKPYMPDRYAAVLSADLKVRVLKRSGREPQVSLIAEGRDHRRKVVQLNDRGILVHPVFARGLRRQWTWRPQFSHVRQGFFSEPVERSAPQIRERISEAMQETARQITRG